MRKDTLTCSDNLLISKISLYFCTASILVGIISAIIGATPILLALISSLILPLWLFSQSAVAKFNIKSQIILCLLWFFGFSVFYVFLFYDIRIERAGRIILYAVGDEQNYIDSFGAASFDITYGGKDLTVFYQTFYTFLKFITIDGQYISNYYFFNVILLLFGNIFLSSALQSVSKTQIGIPSFLFLSCMPEGYFWALSLYKDVLIYFLISFAIMCFCSDRVRRGIFVIVAAGIFRSLLVVLGMVETLYNRKNLMVLERALIFALVGFFVYLNLDHVLDYIYIFFNEEKLNRILFDIYGLNSIPDISVFFVPILLIFGLLFCIAGSIFIIFQPTPFFLNPDLGDQYLHSWSDLTIAGIVSFPLISIYVVYCNKNFFSSIRNDLFFRFSFVYNSILILSFLFLTLRHRFVVSYVFICGALHLWWRIKNSQVKISMPSLVGSFLISLMCAFAVAKVKGN